MAFCARFKKIGLFCVSHQHDYHSRHVTEYTRYKIRLLMKTPIQIYQEEVPVKDMQA